MMPSEGCERSLFREVPQRNKYLLQLEKLRGLHQVLELEGSFRHVMRFAPLLDTSDVVLNLHGYREASARVSMTEQEQITSLP